MNKSHHKTIISSTILIGFVLFITLSLRSHPAENSPMMKVFTGKASGLKIIQMNDERRALANGNEKMVLRQSMFSNAPEFPSFPLIQKKGEHLGTIPTSFADVEAVPDLAISSAGMKTFYKFQFLSGGVSVDLIAIPENRMSDMGKLPKNKWLRPEDVGHRGLFPYRFKLTAVGTPDGDIVYWVFVNDDNPNINKVMEVYMEREGLQVER